MTPTTRPHFVAPVKPKVGDTALVPTPYQVVSLARLILGDHFHTCGHGCEHHPERFAVGWRPGLKLCSLCFAAEARARPAEIADRCDLCRDRQDPTGPTQAVHVQVPELDDLTLVADLCPWCWRMLAEENFYTPPEIRYQQKLASQRARNRSRSRNRFRSR